MEAVFQVNDEVRKTDKNPIMIVVPGLTSDSQSAVSNYFDFMYHKFSKCLGNYFHFMYHKFYGRLYGLLIFL